MGISDTEYTSVGANTAERAEILRRDIICNPKIGDADYLDKLKNQIIFGWVHAVQNRDITDKIIAGNLTAIAWEDMFEGGRHIF